MYHNVAQSVQKVSVPRTKVAGLDPPQYSPVTAVTVMLGAAQHTVYSIHHAAYSIPQCHCGCRAIREGGYGSRDVLLLVGRYTTLMLHSDTCQWSESLKHAACFSNIYKQFLLTPCTKVNRLLLLGRQLLLFTVSLRTQEDCVGNIQSSISD